MRCSSLGYTSSNVSVTISRKLMDIAVLPELRIQHEGRNVTEAIVVDKGSRLQLDCVVFRAIDEPSIVWQVKNITLTEQPGETMSNSNQFVEGTFDFRRRFSYLIERDTELICSSLGNKTINVSVIISTDITEIPDFVHEVPPELSVQLGGKNVTGTVVVDKGTILEIDCVVYRAKEEPDITWQFKNASLTVETEETQNSSNLFVAGTFDFRKTLTYLIEDDTALICSSLGNRSINVSVKISSSLLDIKGKSAEYETDLISFVYVAAIVVFVIFVVSLAGICAYVKMYRGASQSKTKTRSSVRESSRQYQEPLEPDVALESRLIELQDIKGKVTRTLPKAPNVEDSYARNINEEDLYSEISYNLPSGGVYSRKRICLISKLSDGVICERWMGNLTATDGRKKYVFISCLKDVVGEKHFQWDVLVKTLLELPECAYLFRAEGICLDEPSLYLLQGYMTCEPLIEHISMKTKGDKAWMDHPDLLVQGLTDFSLQVTSGMEFVMTHGLSHPGLSVKKILITEDGVCKLYDFCLAEDALQFVEWLKLEADFSSSSHPLECMERNDYTCASDVWYTGFAVLEIFSHGSLQCPDDSSPTQDNGPIYSLSSEFCPLSLNECLKKCLTKNYGERATNLKELLDALKKGADSARIKEQSKPKTVEFSQSHPSPYEPMGRDGEVYC
ncbi:Tyrosine-protein kinase CSK [Holothuria leucospilota]|uniref:Tyrosine-protein kinase CSK n=1 Tax=Holothuria leucospilota TaxID=206669 RepID=A0A9Q1CCZ6_HOLLE|nr:Tyrosine-protein kinase CSK [Holothuria leucospilota]